MIEQRILEELRVAARQHAEWAELCPAFDSDAASVHLAVMVEPFLSYILRGEKTVESRFSKHAIAPFGRVRSGDLVLLKAGPVVGSFHVSSIDFVTVDDGQLDDLRREYSDALCANEDDFWESRTGKRYVTLMGVDKVRELPPVPVSKRDMRGWVVLTPAPSSMYPDQLALM